MKKIIIVTLLSSIFVGQAFSQSVYVGPKGVVVNGASNPSSTVTHSNNSVNPGIKSYVNCDLSNKNMPNTNFKNATITNCDLSNSNFEGSNFENAVLTNVDLSSANLKNTNFNGTKLINVNTDDVKR